MDNKHYINKESNFVSVVAYLTTGYEKVVEEFLLTITSQLESRFKFFELIIVNDQCNDNSVAIIRDFSTKYKKAEISILNMSYCQGKEKSLQAGVDLAIGDYVYEFESMLVDYEASLVLNVYDEALKGYDIVSAAQNYKPQRKSRIFYKIYNQFSNGQYDVNSEMFKIVSRRAINRVQSLSLVIPYRRAAYSSCGLKKTSIVYMPKYHNKIKNHNRDEKAIKMSTAVTSLIVYTSFAVTLAKILMLITVGFVCIYLIVPTIIAPLLNINMKFNWGIFGILIASIFIEIIGTMCIYYLEVVIRLILNKKSYIFDSIEKMTR